MRRVWMIAVLGAGLLATGCPPTPPPAPVVAAPPKAQSRPVVAPPATRPAPKPDVSGRGGLHRPLSAGEENELLKVIKDFKEADYQRLADLKAKDPAQFRAQMRQMWIWYSEWKTMPEPVQQAYWDVREAKAQTAAALADLQADKNGASREKNLARLRQAQGREFDALQVIQTQWAEEFAKRIVKLQGEIESRQKSLEALRGELKARRSDREKILDAKVDSLLKNPLPAQPPF
ncbi:MAG: hypothetical protein NTV86_10570 [Planctomycetota bacterium]|nr:hypothetical protein [Planctomycetota bacterium]